MQAATMQRAPEQTAPVTSDAARRPQLRLVHGGAQAPAGRGRYWRRRLVAVVLLVLLVTAALVAIGQIGADAELADRVAGHVVVEPGETLWDVAVASAPDGFDTRRQLEAIRELNHLHGSHVDAWSVVLLPAH